MVQIILNLEKKYFFGVLGAILILAISIGVYAYGTSNPAVFGHTLGEINGSLGVNFPRWENISLDDSADFDKTCEYRFYVDNNDVYNIYTGQHPVMYAGAVDSTRLTYVSHNSIVSHIRSNEKTKYYSNDKYRSDIPVTKIEKRCG